MERNYSIYLEFFYYDKAVFPSMEAFGGLIFIRSIERLSDGSSLLQRHIDMQYIHTYQSVRFRL
jgi:hypothetical protein